jgi:hypothetical protein
MNEFRVASIPLAAHQGRSDTQGGSGFDLTAGEPGSPTTLSTPGPNRATIRRYPFACWPQEASDV